MAAWVSKEARWRERAQEHSGISTAGHRVGHSLGMVHVSPHRHVVWMAVQVVRFEPTQALHMRPHQFSISPVEQIFHSMRGSNRVHFHVEKNQIQTKIWHSNTKRVQTLGPPSEHFKDQPLAVQPQIWSTTYQQQPFIQRLNLEFIRIQEVGPVVIIGSLTTFISFHHLNRTGQVLRWDG